jgi:aspartate racemase
MKKIVGVIGGNGVAATNKLCELIETRFTQNGAFRDVHHPEMIIWQATQAPSRSMYLEGLGPNFIDDYVAIGKKLSQQGGATVLCMCCNTAHYSIEEIAKKTNLPFLNLVKEVVKEVAKNSLKTVGLIAANGCLFGKVYEKYFECICPETQIIYPDAEFQKEATRGICNIKNQSRFLDEKHHDRPKNIFTKVYNHLMEKGVEKVIIGCTDIRVDFVHNNTIDSLEKLAEIIINYYEEFPAV